MTRLGETNADTMGTTTPASCLTLKETLIAASGLVFWPRKTTVSGSSTWPALVACILLRRSGNQREDTADGICLPYDHGTEQSLRLSEVLPANYQRSSWASFLVDSYGN